MVGQIGMTKQLMVISVLLHSLPTKKTIYLFSALSNAAEFPEGPVNIWPEIVNERI